MNSRGITMPQARKKRKQVDNKIVPFIPDGDFYFTKGTEAFRNRKFDIALKWMKKAVESKPDEPLFQCQMSVIYTEIGAYTAANQLLINVLEKSSDYIDCYYLIANNYAHLGLLNDARKYALTYLEKQPDGDFSEDAKELLEIIDLDDEEDDEFALEDEDELLIYQESAFHFMENKKWEDALTVIEEMIEMFPDYNAAKHDYAFALFHAGRKQEAIDFQLTLLKENPTVLFNYTNLALFYFEQNNDIELMKYVEVLQRIYPIHEHQKLKIAVTLAKVGQYDEAYRRFKQVSKRKVMNHVSYFLWYSTTLYHKEKYTLAKKLWEEGLLLHPQLEKEVVPWG